MTDPTAPLTTTDGLKVGDVVLVARELKDKVTGQPFWWRSFRAILAINNSRSMTVLTLKMNPDLDKDIWDVDLHPSEKERQVVTWVPQERWPQGVNAMWMKHITTGLIKLSGD